MTDHPYSSTETLAPGELADDDPFTEDGEYCGECDEEVEPIVDECPRCGLELK
jgi:hypothetical protein